MLNFRGLLSSSLLVPMMISAPSGPAASQPSVQSQLSWPDVVNRVFTSKEPRAPGAGGRGGPRPANLCWITPTDTLWNSRPRFVWVGNFRAVGLRSVGAETMLWRSVAPTGNQRHQLEYTGVPLEAGKAYEWVFFFGQNSSDPLLRVPFQIVNAAQQTVIKADLARLDAQYQKQQISEEVLALQRANYFAGRQLKSDVLQEVYSVKNPSAQLQQVRRDLEAKVCQRK